MALNIAKYFDTIEADELFYINAGSSSYIGNGLYCEPVKNQYEVKEIHTITVTSTVQPNGQIKEEVKESSTTYSGQKYVYKDTKGNIVNR